LFGEFYKYFSSFCGVFEENGDYFPLLDNGKAWYKRLFSVAYYREKIVAIIKNLLYLVKLLSWINKFVEVSESSCRAFLARSRFTLEFRGVCELKLSAL
jgi:hypothetical protein